MSVRAAGRGGPGAPRAAVAVPARAEPDGPEALPAHVPDELSARVPVEQRVPGAGRDGVRLLVSRGRSVSHHAFVDLPRLLRAGDLLVVNTSPTLPAAVDATVAHPAVGHARVVVHFSTRGDDGRWAVELREPDGSGSTRARAGGPAGAELVLPEGVRLVLDAPLSEHSGRLWWARVRARTADGAVHPARTADAARPARTAVGGVRPSAGVPGLLHRHGRPIRYAYTERDQPLSAYQTVFALPSPGGAGSAEMPSAGRPFTDRLVAELVSRGVQFAPVTLHTGVASAEAHEPPYPERFAVPAASARLINGARAGGGRILAIGTTAVRAVESAADETGVVRAAAGWTDLVITPERGVRVVDGLLTGLHEPEASHLLMLIAISGKAAVARGYTEAVRRLYLWHEFGDSHLLLPDERRDRTNCGGNSW